MPLSVGHWVFLLAPVVLGSILLWAFPDTRQIRAREVAIYLVVMSTLIYGALQLVAWIATARVPLREVAIVLWFTLAWRFGWSLWSRTVGRLGQRWVRWGRQRRRQGAPVPLRIRLIPLGRAMLTALVFIPAFLCTVVTHRCKLTDGQDPQSVYSTNYEHVRIPTADGLTLDGWFIPQPFAERTVVICHGAGANKGNFIWYLGPLLNEGYNVLFFDFRAHGASDGRTATYGIREKLDVLAAVDWVKRERPTLARRIVGIGSSQGAMALALAAAEEPRIDAVVLDSPFVSPRELVHAHFDRLPLIGKTLGDWLLLGVSAETGTNFFAASAEQAVSQLGSRPVMVVRGDKDIGMPAAHSQRLYDAARGPREIWFGPGPHSNIITTDPDGYARRLFRFLDDNLGPARPARKRRLAPTTVSAPASQP